MEQIMEIKSLAEVQGKLLDTTKELKSALEKANGEISESRKTETETQATIEKLSIKAAELTDKCMLLERKITDQEVAHEKSEENAGEMLTKSEMFQAMQSGRAKYARVEVKAIINATGQNQPLVADARVPGIVAMPNRILTIRDLLPIGRTVSNLIQYTRENTFTNNAGPQFDSPSSYENVTKPESNITFTLENAPVVTLAHWIPVSRQVLDDAPQLQSYVNGRLMYGMKLIEEDQLLNGDGLTGNISGLLDSGNFTAYNRATTGDTNIDTLRRAITQCALSEFTPDAIVLNPQDWEEIELTKNSDQSYIMANPVMMAGPTLWGKRVVATNSIQSGTFLVANFGLGAQLWDRMDAAVAISYEDGDNFKKNMATLLAEERIALTVFRPSAFISGSF